MKTKSQPYPGIVTLITDFGLSESYVGQLKGALLTRESSLTIIDITHEIRPQDIDQAAYELFTSYKHFPPGTIHMVVVDPGVGTERAILAAKSQEHVFVAPDNGVLSLLFASEVIEQVATVSTKPQDTGISSTFHGRDIMAPVAALLAQGNQLESIGDMVQTSDCIVKRLGGVVRTAKGIQGKVLRIDHFGNIRTSIQKGDIEPGSLKTMKVTLRGHCIQGLSTTYGDNPAGVLCCLFDSDGFLELAQTNGNAAKLLQAAVDDVVDIFF